MTTRLTTETQNGRLALEHRLTVPSVAQVLPADETDSIDVTDALLYSNELLDGNAFMTGLPQVIRSIEIPSPPGAVWRWLATQDGLRRWISPNIEIDLRVGGAYRFIGPDDRTWISGTVLELVPERSLILSWLEEGSGWVDPARLVINLGPVPSGTRVTVVHDGFEGIGRPEWDETVQDYERGADKHRILERLANLVNAGDAER